MLLRVPINRAKCICEMLRKNVKDAHILWKRLYLRNQRDFKGGKL